MNNIDFFVKNWRNSQSMIAVNNDDILALESKLDATLPDTYKYLISTYGLLHTPNVLTKTCDLGVEISNVRDFLSLDDVSTLSELYEMSGMPKGHILFASDSKGNMFCFKHADCESKQKNIPVWFFDHQFSTVKKVSNSFSEWLLELNDL
jgi:hypothetical protein